MNWVDQARRAGDAVAQWRDGGVPDEQLLEALNAIEQLLTDTRRYRDLLKSRMLKLASEGVIVYRYREKGDDDGAEV